MTGLLRAIFLAIDVEFTHLKPELIEQYRSAQFELMEVKRLKTVNMKLVAKSERQYVKDKDQRKLSTRFEYFLYRKAEQLFRSNLLTVKESVNNRSLASDMIPGKEWKETKQEIIDKTGLEKLSVKVSNTVAMKQKQLDQRLKKVCKNIFKGENQYVKFLAGKKRTKMVNPESPLATEHR